MREVLHDGKDIPGLTGLRGVAAVVVAVSHFSNESQLFGAALGNGAGQVGVMIFFALSAWLMMHLYGSEAAPRLQQRATYGLAFLWKRFTRVVPLFVAVVLVSYAFGTFGPSWANWLKITPDNIGPVLLLQGNDSVLWTIGPELVFYTAFFFFLLLPGWLRPGILVMLGLLAVLSLARPDFNWLEVFGLDWGRLTHEQFVDFKVFALGAVFCVLFSRAGTFVLSPAAQIPIALAAVLGFALLYPSGFALVSWRAPANYGWNEPVTIILVLFILTAATIPGPFRAVLSTRPALFLGKISFSLYLCHFLVLNAMSAAGLMAPTLGSLGLAAIGILALSTVLHFTVEYPSLMWLRRLPARLRDGGRPMRVEAPQLDA